MSETTVTDMTLSGQAVRQPDPAQVNALMRQVDLSDANSIATFGTAAQARLTEVADRMLDGVRNQDTGPAGDALSGMLATLRGFDVSKLGEKRGFLDRLLGRAGAAVQALQKYEGVRSQLEAAGDKLETHKTKLMEDIASMDRLYGATLEWFHALATHIEAGEQVLARLDTESIPEAAKAAEGGDMLLAQQLRDMRSARDDLERRVHDLRLTRQVAMQALPQIRLVQENDKALIGKITSVLANTVPLWRAQLAQAVAIARMQEAGKTLQQATDLTNTLLTSNAETLRQGNVEARTQIERGAFDIEAIKAANTSLIATIEDSLRIADEGRAKRVGAVTELARCEAELKQALLAAKARTETLPPPAAG